MSHPIHSQTGRKLKYPLPVLLAGLTIILVSVCILSLRIGALAISGSEVTQILLYSVGLAEPDFSSQQEVVVLNLRLPRTLLAVLVGGALGVAGAALQGLFRNPLVEPGLMGVSSGAALFVVFAIVFGASFPVALSDSLAAYQLPMFAFVGGLLTTLLVYGLSIREGKTDIAVLILAGVAINALANALTGLIIFYADDTALRNFTFWTLGDLGGATWSKLAICAPLLLLPSLGLIFFRDALNALAMGESEAYYLGISVEKVKYGIILLAALAVGTSVSQAGIIGFIGLVVPHILRMGFGPDHRWILPGSLIGGAILLLIADILARTVVAPAELPIGILTALLGGPFFMWLLIQAKKKGMI